MISLKVVVAWSMDIVLFFDAIGHQAICEFLKIYSRYTIFQNFSIFYFSINRICPILENSSSYKWSHCWNKVRCWHKSAIFEKENNVIGESRIWQPSVSGKSPRSHWRKCSLESPQKGLQNYKREPSGGPSELWPLRKWDLIYLKTHQSDRLHEDEGQLNAECNRIENENKRLKDEFLRLTIQYSG